MSLYSDLISSLMDRGLLRPVDLAGPGIGIRELSARHSVYQVTGPGVAHVVKDTSIAETREGLAFEGEIYEALSHAPLKNATLSRHVPTVEGSDEVGFLILESVDGRYLAEEMFERSGLNRTDLARSFGELVAEIHLLPLEQWASLYQNEAAFIPGVLEYLQPDVSRYMTLTGAQVEMLRTIHQFPELLRAFDELQHAWIGQTFIHGDLSLSNVLVCPDTFDIVILDWELAGPGDPRWDVGTVLAEWLDHWVSAIPLVSGIAVNQLAQSAEALHHAVTDSTQRFLQAYALKLEQRGRTGQQREWLVSVTRFAGLRLFQKALERGYYLAVPTGHEQLLMQLGMNLTLMPEEAAANLFQQLRMPE